MFGVEIFTEDDHEAIDRYEVETIGEASLIIKEHESETGDVIDYVRVTEGDDHSWYLVKDDYTFASADNEVSESLDFDFGDSLDDLISESGWFEELLSEEIETLDEQLKRRVDSKGRVKRTQSKKVRSRRATRTTGMSKSSLKRRSRKAAKTRRRDVGGTRRASKKRKKAMRRRRQMGIRN